MPRLIAHKDTSCILAWLIEQGYEVYTFMADVGQEEVLQQYITLLFLLIDLPVGFCCGRKESPWSRRKKVLFGGEN
jgi:hypothetical protein